MQLLSKDISKFKNLVFLFLLVFIFSFNSLNVFAEEGSSEPDYNSVFDYEAYEDKPHPPRIKKSAHRKSAQLELKDSVFNGGSGISLNALIMRILMVVIGLLGVLFFIKRYLSGNQTNGAGNILDNLAQKISGNFSSFAQSTIKLKQAMILTPGQNIYLVEVEGRKLLLGGTQHGGVQFLADLTNKASSKAILDFKQIEEYQSLASNNNVAVKEIHKQQANHFEMQSNQAPENILFAQTSVPVIQSASNGNIQNNNPMPVEKEIYSSNMTIPKQPFKRRTNFRKSLLNDSMQNSEELVKAK